MELTAEDENGEEVTHTILSLRVGGTEQVRTVTTGERSGRRRTAGSVIRLHSGWQHPLP